MVFAAQRLLMDDECPHPSYTRAPDRFAKPADTESSTPTLFPSRFPCSLSVQWPPPQCILCQYRIHTFFMFHLKWIRKFLFFRVIIHILHRRLHFVLRQFSQKRNILLLCRSSGEGCIPTGIFR